MNKIENEFTAWCVYYALAEENDRLYPGAWSEYESDCWIPLPEYMKFTGQYARDMLKKLHLSISSPIKKHASKMTYKECVEYLKYREIDYKIYENESAIPTREFGNL